MIVSQSQGKGPGREKFMFSTRWAQNAEAFRNAKEAQELLRRFVPAHRRSAPLWQESETESAPPPAKDAATSLGCFRRVSEILRGRR